jgi:hypothetical protein
MKCTSSIKDIHEKEEKNFMECWLTAKVRQRKYAKQYSYGTHKEDNNNLFRKTKYSNAVLTQFQILRLPHKWNLFAMG